MNSRFKGLYGCFCPRSGTAEKIGIDKEKEVKWYDIGPTGRTRKTLSCMSRNGVPGIERRTKGDLTEGSVYWCTERRKVTNIETSVQ